MADDEVGVDTNAPAELPVDVTTVTDTGAVVHATRADGSVDVHRFDGLDPDAEHRLDLGDGRSVVARTLPARPGPVHSRIATVNDVHFGETVAGQVDDLEMGPLRRSEPDAEPYAELMNRTAVAEIATAGPDAVIVKGDLSLDGTDEEWEAFERCYRVPFGDRLHVVRGNHDAYRNQTRYAGDRRIDLDGLTVALIDTTIPGSTTGGFDDGQADWLDALAGDATSPVLVCGHHQQWIPGAGSDAHEQERSPDYFGIHPDGSDLLDDVFARHPILVAYTAGHTHRHRVRRMSRSGAPSIEVGCTKDFPGTWAEYRVHDDALVQIVHRISDPDALRWSESCRHLYADFGIDYEHYALGTIDDRCCVLPFR